MKYLVLVSLLLALILTGCGSDAKSDSSDSSEPNANSSSNLASNNANSPSFAIEFSTDMSLSDSEGKASEGNRVTVAGAESYAMVRFENAATSLTPRMVQILFENDELTKGEQAVDRVLVATYITQDGETMPISCDANDEASLTVNITAVDGNLASGEFSFDVGSCEHYITPDQAINVETVSVSGSFSDVPYKPTE